MAYEKALSLISGGGGSGGGLNIVPVTQTETGLEVTIAPADVTPGTVFAQSNDGAMVLFIVTAAYPDDRQSAEIAETITTNGGEVAVVTWTSTDGEKYTANL